MKKKKFVLGVLLLLLLALLAGAAFASQAGGSEGGKKDSPSVQSELQTYSVHFNTRCDAHIDSYTDVPAGTAVAAPADPPRDGYEFGGWYREIDCVNRWDFSAPVESDMTLHAKWTYSNGPRTDVLRVSFDYQGAAGGDSVKSASFELGEPFALPNPHRLAYSFGGWFSGVGGTGIECLSGEPAPLIGDMTMYAYWIGSDGITYEPSPDGASYVVTGWSGTGDTLAIPEYHGGKPVTSIKAEAFFYKHAGSVHMPRTMASIGKGAFLGSDLSSVTFAPGCALSSVGEKAFSRCKLASIEIPAHLTSIGKGAFSENGLLASVGFAPGSRMAATGEDMFSECTALKSIALPPGTRAVGAGSFYRCSSLDSAILPAGVEKIGDRAFYWCEKLEGISLPSSVKSVGSLAFLMCFSLREITLPEGVKVLESGVFASCTSLESVRTASDITGIGGGSFSQCKALKAFFIPSSVKTIGASAFSECDSLSISAEVLESQVPQGWDAGWNPDGCPVAWGAKRY
ncbi:MAG: leucine-rich repeat protein [Candidatus Methanoplasma sp.]|jgi:uncharacterized repeat protein (TIGR02543 family)|nr:leucine-rich repeat protein [Candidatus Methanoplasma sp.]